MTIGKRLEKFGEVRIIDETECRLERKRRL